MTERTEQNRTYSLFVKGCRYSMSDTYSLSLDILSYGLMN